MFRPAAVVFAIALTLSTAARGAEPQVLDVERAEVHLPSGEQIKVEGGCWLSTERCVLTAREIERLRKENAELRESAGEFPTAAVVVALAVGVFAGGAAVALTHR